MAWKAAGLAQCLLEGVQRTRKVAFEKQSTLLLKPELAGGCKRAHSLRTEEKALSIAKASSRMDISFCDGPVEDSSFGHPLFPFARDFMIAVPGRKSSPTSLPQREVLVTRVRAGNEVIGMEGSCNKPNTSGHQAFTT